MSDMKAHMQPDDSSGEDMELNRGSYEKPEDIYERFSRLADEHQHQILEDARREAAANPNKEAFDPAKLERLLDRGELSDSAKRHHEVRYDTDPDILSIEEYATLYLDIEAGGTS